jgi:hypothetical protein
MSATTTHPGAELGLPLAWIDFDETPILLSNNFLIQHQPHEFVITFGQVTGPPLVGSPDQIRDQAHDMTHVPINTMCRVGMTRHRLVELIALLQANLEDHDRLVGER